MAATSLTGLSLRDLIDAGLHFGHQTKRWNPKMRPYIFDKRNGIHIIDLTQTIEKLEETAEFLRETILNGKKVLFVATKKQVQEIAREAAEDCGQFYVTHRWLGGMLTNNPTIRHSVRRMRQIEAIARNNDGVLSAHKKEAASLRRELDKLQRNLSGIADMEQLPGAMLVVDVCRESIAIAEARRLEIPVVAMVDTNADPDLVDYPIPGNDDAIRAVKTVLDALAAVMKKANDEYSKLAAEKNRQEEAERAARAAAAQAKREQKETKTDAEAKAELAEQRKEIARKARKVVEAHARKATKAADTTEASAKKPAAKPEASPTAAESKPAAPTKAASVSDAKAQAPAPEKDSTETKTKAPVPETEAADANATPPAPAKEAPVAETQAAAPTKAPKSDQAPADDPTKKPPAAQPPKKATSAPEPAEATE